MGNIETFPTNSFSWDIFAGENAVPVNSDPRVVITSLCQSIIRKIPRYTLDLEEIRLRMRVQILLDKMEHHLDGIDEDTRFQLVDSLAEVGYI